MKIGALIVTTGLPRVSGVAALQTLTGSITAGQRMISAFQCAGVSMVGLVVGPEDKKAERPFAQNGVVFLRNTDAEADFFRGVQFGLTHIASWADRVFVVPADTPLFLPQTLTELLRQDANIVQPQYQCMNCTPVLLDRTAMDMICDASSEEEARIVAEQLSREYVSVPDAGILLRGSDMTHRKALIHRHNAQLTRPMTEVSLFGSGPLYDPRLSMLLHLVEQTRSVRDACSLMQMSYSTAWNMLNRVEDVLGFPLVVRSRGGSSGSGSFLTEKGRKLMNAYDRFTEELNKTACGLYSDYFGDLDEWNS